MRWVILPLLIALAAGAVILVALFLRAGKGPAGTGPGAQALPVAKTAAGAQEIVATGDTTAVPHFGILGDSTSDEYRADDKRGGKFGATTLNWVEQLVKRRGVDFGKWGKWGEPRRTGFEYNWSRSGATTSDLIRSGQHTGLAQQVAQGRVTHVLIWVGENDFAQWNGKYQEIYEGKLSEAQRQAKVDSIVQDISLAADTILAAKPVPVVIVGIADRGLAPDAQFPDPLKRLRVTTMVNGINARLRDAAAARHIAYADPNSFISALVPRLNVQGSITVGGEQIRLLEKGNEPHFGRVDDSVGHAGTVVSGLIANAIFVESFRQYYGVNIPPLSDDEILADAGLKADPTPAPVPAIK